MADSAGLLPLLTPDTPGLDVNATEVPKIIAVSVVLIILSTSAVILRFISRMLSKAGLWWDDWVIVAALVMSSWATCIQESRLIVSGYDVGCMSSYDNECVHPTSDSWRSAEADTNIVADTKHGFGQHMAVEGSFEDRVGNASYWFKSLYAHPNTNRIVLALTMRSAMPTKQFIP